MRVFVLALVVVLSAPLFAQNPDSRWDARFTFGQIDGIREVQSNPRNIVEVAIPLGDSLVIGGRFDGPSQNIVIYDKTRREYFPLGTGVNGRVISTVILGSKIYVGGIFSRAGDVEAKNIAAWDLTRARWEPVGSGLANAADSGEVSALTTYRGELVAGGLFTRSGSVSLENVARWNGTTWAPMGAIPNSTNWSSRDQSYLINKFATFNDTLYLSGAINGLSSGRRATFQPFHYFDGVSWRPLIEAVYTGSRFSNYNWFHIDANQTSLFLSVCGDTIVDNSFRPVLGSVFRYRNGQVSALVSKLRPVSEEIIFGMRPTAIILASHATDSGIVIAGQFAGVAQFAVSGLAHIREDGTGVQAVAGSELLTAGNRVNGMIVSRSDIYFYGNFDNVGSQAGNSIARVNRSTGAWDIMRGRGPRYQSLNARVRLAQGSQGLLFTGNTRFAGDKQVNNVGIWNGATFEPIGAGLPFYPLSGFGGGAQNAPIVEHPSLGILVGYTQDPFSRDKNAIIYRWDGRSWQAFDTSTISAYQFGTGQNFLPSVTELAVIGNELYAAGNFRNLGGISASMVARYSNGTWSNMGGGIEGATTSQIYPTSLAADFRGNLFMTGIFTTVSGQNTGSCAVFRGGSWSKAFTPQTGPQLGDQFANAIVFRNDSAIVAGYFTENGRRTGGLALWTGSRFEILLKDPAVFVQDLAWLGDSVYIGGQFSVVDSVPANNIAVVSLKSRSWAPLGSGTNGIVTSMVFWGDTLYISGNFSRAGQKPSRFFAAWRPAGRTTSTVEQVQNDSEIQLFPNPVTGGLVTILCPTCATSGGVSTVKVVDLLGQTLTTTPVDFSGGSSGEIDVSGLPPGSYSILVGHGSIVRTKSFIKHR